MQEAPGGQHIQRTMKYRRDRKSIIHVGNVKIEIVPVGVDGHNGWQVVIPDGGRIEHQTLTNSPAKP